jgi:hypothetical protein
MAGEAAREGPDLDPVVRAAVEARARQSGLSLSDYLTRLIHAPAHGYPTQGSFPMTSWIGPLGSGSSHDLALRGTLFGEPAGAGSGYIAVQAKAVGGPNDLQPDLFHPEGASAFVSPALRLVVMFSNRIHGASLLLSAAFLEAAVPDFRPPARHGSARRARSSWYDQIVNTCLDRSREVRNALVHRWTPTARAERLALNAFVLLSDLTPASTELQLCRYDRPRAFSELARHLDLLTSQFSLSADLLAEVEAVERPPARTEERRFADLATGLLERAGGGMSLTEGAKLLGISRQALHKRVKAGSALGMMQGAELVLPRVQFVTGEGKTRLLNGLSKVVTLFETSKAGVWSALQFLIDPDPNLGGTPLDALREKRVEAVVNAARAYLGVDED